MNLEAEKLKQVGIGDQVTNKLLSEVEERKLP